MTFKQISNKRLTIVFLLSVFLIKEIFLLLSWHANERQGPKKDGSRSSCRLLLSHPTRTSFSSLLVQFSSKIIIGGMGWLSFILHLSVNCHYSHG